MKLLKEEIELLWRREEMFWGLRSRINWLRWGDKNTKYFSCSNYLKATQEQNNYAEEYIGAVGKGHAATSAPHHIFF